MTVTIGVSTGGGDAPGLNAVIEAVTRSAELRGWRVKGIRDGLDGLLDNDKFPGGSGLVDLDTRSVLGISGRGGTILGAASQGNPLEHGATTDDVAAGFARHGIDALVAVGGDGTQRIAHAISAAGLRVVGAPKTIDNDLVGTATTFGFDTAVQCVVDCLDRLRTTVDAHARVMVVEVMGRHAGWIALHGGLAGDADAILIPERPYDDDALAHHLDRLHRGGARSSIVVVAEGAHRVGGSVVFVDAGRDRPGGIGEQVAAHLDSRLDQDVRHVNLGHLVRGGSPVASDRLLGLRLGAAAIRVLDQGRDGVMVGWDGTRVLETPLAEVAARTKSIPADSDAVTSAVELGIYIG